MKSVPGYNVYRIRMKADEIRTGRMIITIRYNYQGKYIDVVATYDVATTADGSNDITLTEGPVETELVFDETLNNTTFDEALLDPEEEDI